LAVHTISTRNSDSNTDSNSDKPAPVRHAADRNTWIGDDATRWNHGGVSGSIPEVSVEQLPPDAVLLDVREDDEWAAGHAPGAVHVPMTQLADRLDDIPDGSPVYVICRSGGRSARATAYLNQQGWDSVNVSGGMGSWARAGRPMEADGDAAPEVI